MIAWIAAGLAMAVPTSMAHAFWPVIAIPPHIELQPRDGQPLASFRFDMKFAGDAKQPSDGIRLKLFLTQASILDIPASPPDITLNVDGKTKLPAALSLTAPELLPSPVRVVAAAKEMPPDIADAVKLLLQKDGRPREPDETAPKGKLTEPADPATRAAVSQAVDVLRGASTARPQIVGKNKTDPASASQKELVDPQRELKLAEVANQIDALNASLVAPIAPLAPPPPTFAPPTISPPASIETFELTLTLPELIQVPTDSATAKTGEEEQDAVKLAVDKAVSSLLAQPPEAPTSLPTTIPVVSTPITRVAATCSTCGRTGGLRPLHRLGDHSLSGHTHSEGGCATCGGGWRCAPGHEPCQPCEAHDGPLGRMFCDFYECLCCPDPCYEPTWRQVPNAALFVDGARPVTQTEIRFNASRGGVFPDRAEFLWARADGLGRGPRPPAGRIGEFRFNYDDLILITETAKDKFSMIVEVPYRAVSPDTYAHGAGFTDMAIGTKTLLFDCELLQVAMQMKTYLPLGNALKGVGPGHLSLEPSLLFALKLHQDTYAQAQISEWIPIGGDPGYAGSILHTHASLNHVVYRFGPDIPLVGTVETNTYSFQDGAYTDPVLGAFQKASGQTYASMGPGLRLFFCDKLDFGFGAALSLTTENFSRQYYRTSVRLRF